MAIDDRSPTCAVEDHPHCLHMYGSVEVGEGEVGLCSCDCHQSCPLARRRAIDFWEWRSACTCPGSENLRGVQDQPGSVLEVMARRLESFRRMAGDEDARREMGKQALVHLYEAAAAQAAEQPIDPHTSAEDLRFRKESMVYLLANMESDATAARMLGLSEAEVAAMRKSARESQARTFRWLIDSTRKRRQWWRRE